jgi:hypothetical protein
VRCHANRAGSEGCAEGSKGVVLRGLEGCAGEEEGEKEGHAEGEGEREGCAFFKNYDRPRAHL